MYTTIKMFILNTTCIYIYVDLQSVMKVEMFGERIRKLIVA